MESTALDSVDNSIIEFLASGTPAADVASMCGVSLTTIQSKLVDLKERIQQRGRQLRSERVEQKYAETEEKILNRVKKEAEDDLAEVGPLIRALEVIARNRVMYRNPAGLGAPATAQQLNIINLHLPAAAVIAPSVTLNTHGEIVAVGDRNMASMPIENVQKIFQTMDKQKEPQHEAAAEHQPATIEHLEHAATTAGI